MNYTRVISKFKYNRFIRGVYFMWSAHFGVKKSSFAYCADNVVFTPPIMGHFNNVYIGSNVGIGPHSLLSSPHAKIIIKENCAIAEHLTIHTGNHARITGKFITDITEENKPEGYDKDVIIEEDVWIGSNVTLLSGVTTGRGATVAAGAVVSKSMPPYCICGGVPARVIKFYWSIDQILEHESKLYEKNLRHTREQLEEIMNKYSK